MSINTRANKAPRPAADFEIHLDRQLSFLQRSCAAFDAGEYDEAVRIALIIRVLLHDTGQSTSLFTHLGLKNRISYVDTGIYRFLLEPAKQAWIDKHSPGGIGGVASPSEVGLVEIGDAGEGRIGWFAPLQFGRSFLNPTAGKAMRRFSTFDHWWKDPLVETTNQKVFSRSDLVLIMANQDGGGHVDASLDADYKYLSEDPLFHAEYSNFSQDPLNRREVKSVLHNVAFASVRQIAFELKHTLAMHKYVRSNPGIFLMGNPYKGMNVEISEPPHKAIWKPDMIISSRPSNTK